MKTLKRNLNIVQTRKNYRKVAWFYNLWSRLTESKASEKSIEFAELKNGDKVIEIACGTGLVFEKILRKNPAGLNLGIDLSGAMLSKAKKLMKRGKFQNYELQQGNVFELKIADNTFDKLLNNFMIDLMPENEFDRILSEFYRILKPDGIAIISVFSNGQKQVNNIWIWIAKYFPKLLTDCRPVEIRQNLINTGFVIEEEIEISQNTFPSKVYKLRLKGSEK